MKQKIRLTENELKQIVAESVKNILNEARKPNDRTVGRHTLKGLRYDKNGNPLYTSDTMSDDEKKNQGWRFSKKHGLYGQLGDPTKLHESGYDSCPLSGYEDFKRVGENTAYVIYRQLRDNVINGHWVNLDGECIQEIIRGFEDRLWHLVEHGEFDEYEAKFKHPLGVSRDEYIKDVENGEYNW